MLTHVHLFEETILCPSNYKNLIKSLNLVEITRLDNVTNSYVMEILMNPKCGALCKTNFGKQSLSTKG